MPLLRAEKRSLDLKFDHSQPKLGTKLRPLVQVQKRLPELAEVNAAMVPRLPAGKRPDTRV